ncbi:MAG: response regulator transcription factor [Myxococcota bacterium]
MTVSSRILVIEDDPRIGAQVVSGLIREGFDATLASDGDQGRSWLFDESVDLVVLDIMLPGADGFSILESWEGRSSVPVIVLTARTDLEDRLRSFALGAVDFLVKPFYLEELVARIRTRLGARQVEPSRVIEIGTCAIDLDARDVRRDGASLGLTAHEFNVISTLAMSRGRAFSREQLATKALPERGDRLERTVDSHISRIRRKLGPDGAMVRTVFGVGYRIDAE